MREGITLRVRGPLWTTISAVAVVALLLSMSGTAWGHQTQGSPVDKWCSTGQGKVCLTDTTRNPDAQATYTGSDGWYGENVYPTTSYPLDQSVVNVGNLGSSCTVYIRDLVNFGGWSRAIFLGQGVGFGTGSTYYRDTSSHHWCTSS